MPRRAKVTKREVLPDPKYHCVNLSRIINKMMKGGKKSTSQKVAYRAMQIIEEQTKRNPIDTLEQAIRNVTPALEVRPRRVGGATYQVPVEVRTERALSLALRWLVKSAKWRSAKPMAEKLAGELMDAAQGQGVTIKKRVDTHKMAEANKAFAHYLW